MRLLGLLGPALFACSAVHAEDVERPYIAFASVPYRGHATPVHALAQELSDRGYDTEFITMDAPGLTDDFARATSPRYISLFPFVSFCPEENQKLMFQVLNGEIPRSKLDPAQVDAFWRCLAGYYEEFLPAITRRFSQRRPDLVVSDYFTVCAIDAALNLSIPLVINSPTTLTTESFNLPAGWSDYHPWNTQDLGAGSIPASLRRWLNHTQRRFFHIISTETPFYIMHRIMRDTHGGPSFANLASPSSVPHLVNMFFGLEYAQPVPSHFTLVGPILSREAEAEAVGNPDIKRELGISTPLHSCPEMVWLDGLVEENPQASVILVNFGTSGMVKPRQLQAILDGFAELQANETTSSFRILWRISDDHYAHLFGSDNVSNNSIPSYIHFIPWFCSQSAVLHHPAVRLFVSHAGINSPQEAILSGVPILAIPCFGDQLAMAMRIADSGVGLFLPPGSFTSRMFTQAVAQIIAPQSTFSAKVQMLRNVLISDPAGLGRTQGANVIEAVLRRGYKHLVPQETKEPGWAKAGLDITILDIMVVMVLLWAMKLASRQVWNFLVRMKHQLGRKIKRE
ncbi:glycosyltransferase family 1 protein [Ramaria rubella]|nr:glycosyltransferase family 1 protein [Ramaria rubella]